MRKSPGVRRADRCAPYRDGHDLPDGCLADMELQAHGESCCLAKDDFDDCPIGLSESGYNHP